MYNTLNIFNLVKTSVRMTIYRIQPKCCTNIALHI